MRGDISVRMALQREFTGPAQAAQPEKARIAARAPFVLVHEGVHVDALPNPDFVHIRNLSEGGLAVRSDVGGPKYD